MDYLSFSYNLISSLGNICLFITIYYYSIIIYYYYLVELILYSIIHQLILQASFSFKDYITFRRNLQLIQKILLRASKLSYTDLAKDHKNWFFLIIMLLCYYVNSLLGLLSFYSWSFFGIPFNLWCSSNKGICLPFLILTETYYNESAQHRNIICHASQELSLDQRDITLTASMTTSKGKFLGKSSSIISGVVIRIK